MNATEKDPAVGQIESVLTDLVKCVVNQPDKVSVISSVHGPLIALVVRPEKSDVSRVIGSRGKHFKALDVILKALAKEIGREVHFEVDDKGPPAGPVGPKLFSYGKFDPEGFAKAKDTFRRLVSMFMEAPNSGEVVVADFGNTTILEVRVNSVDYASLYGTEMTFDYGVDGSVIGSIKNIFDGIGKRYGRVFRVVLVATG
mgnify:CR=1 FL=1